MDRKAMSERLEIEMARAANSTASAAFTNGCEVRQKYF